MQSTTKVINRPERLPPWLRLSLPRGRRFARTEGRLESLHLHTVCESARCPNRWECWSHGTATFMIAGDRCTRACGFCAVTAAKPLPLDADEPRRVAEAARRMELKHVVVTSVARDDLADGGAAHFARTICELRAACGEGLMVEVLTPDFGGERASLEAVLVAQPDVFNHNIETVRRLTPKVRHRATYERTLAVLRMAASRPAHLVKDRRLYIKSGLMVGHGETAAEVLETMGDLRAAGCELLTIGQYLQPTPANLPVTEFVRPEVFAELRQAGRAMGFLDVASAPLVRSSYHAADLLQESRK